ncbi:DUF7571 family protein [Halobellus rubicundus]
MWRGGVRSRSELGTPDYCPAYRSDLIDLTDDDLGWVGGQVST